ncbi:MAG: hypothetical protein QOE61_1128, partial [Micromonosporaceae bacterium]|nr:hypothetical protein [Micromonosporaceae bacterium]
HLASCAECRTECAKLSEVPAFLSLLTQEDVRWMADEFAPRKRDADRSAAVPTPRVRTGAPPSRPPTQTANARPATHPQPSGDRGRNPRAAKSDLPRHRSRFALAAVALALIVGVSVGLGLATRSPAAITLAGSDTNAVTGVTTSVSVVGLDNGSHVTATVKGLHPGVEYKLFAVDSHGQTQTVVRWSAENKAFAYAGDVQIRAEDLAFFTITELDGQVVITVKVAKAS